MTVERTTRRKADAWDRVKLTLVGLIVLAIGLSSRVNAPFTTFGEAVEETLVDFWWLILLLGLEFLRQIHYYLSEKSAGYHTFWTDRVFGGVERGTQRRFSPWFRFRVGRYVRLFVYFTILGAIADFLGDQWNNPYEALAGLPRFLLENIGEIAQFLFFMFIIVAQFGMLFWFLSRGGVKYVMPEEIETRYDDVWGQDHVLELVKENMGFLERPDEIEEKGGYVPGGILLWGPPGTGKTLIAEATAGEVGVPFVFIEPGAFINMFMGVGILKVKGLFRKLRKLSLRHGGVVAFFDEADALGSRGAVGQGQGPPQPMVDQTMLGSACNGFTYLSPVSQRQVVDWIATDPESTEQDTRGPIHRIIMGGMGGGGGGMGTLQALLTELSGLKQPRGISNRIRKALGMKPKPPPKYRIFVMMASNLPEALDPALLRPGRLDRIYRVGYPSREGRQATIEGYFDKVDHELTQEQVADLAIKTPYYSGAKIKDLVNESLILAIRDSRTVITWDDVWKAKVLKELGPPENTEYIERERHAIAVHEACHAVVAHLTMAHRSIDMATIQRHNQALGMVKPIQIEDRVTQWRTEYEADIMTSLASLAGEKMFFEGDNSSGVSADLRNATSLASYMSGVFGMGNRITSLSAMHLGRFGAADPSPDILKVMPEVVEALLREFYDKTEQLLRENYDNVLAVAAALEEKRTISGSDITEIMGSEPGSLVGERAEGWSTVDPQRAQRSVGNPNGEGADESDVAVDITEREIGNGQPEAEDEVAVHNKAD